MDMEILLRDVENTELFYPFLTKPGYFESKQQQLILNVDQEFKGWRMQFIWSITVGTDSFEPPISYWNLVHKTSRRTQDFSRIGGT